MILIEFFEFLLLALYILFGRKDKAQVFREKIVKRRKKQEKKVEKEAAKLEKDLAKLEDLKGEDNGNL